MEIETVLYSVPPNAIRGMPKGIHTVDLAYLALIHGTKETLCNRDSINISSLPNQRQMRQINGMNAFWHSPYGICRGRYV